MPTKLGTSFASGHSGSAKPFSPQTKARKDRHTPENVEGLPVHQLRVRLCMHVTFLRKRSKKRRAARASARRQRKGNVRVEICSCVGWLWALAAWGCGIVSPPPAHQVSLLEKKTRMFPLPFSPPLSLSFSHVCFACALELVCRRVCDW